MTEPNVRRTAPSRRAFLAAAGVAPLLAVPRDDGDDFAAAARLTGLDFTAADRALAVAALQEQRQSYAALRARPLPFELPIGVHFDPLPPNTPTMPRGNGVAWRPRADLPAPADDLAIAFATVDELATWLRQGKVTSLQLTELALARLVKLDPTLHCVITLLRDEALATARERDAELAAGKPRGPLHGIPFGAKDLFAWPSAPTTFGAAPYQDQRWDLTATVLQKLHDQGAVLVAKLSLGALAMGDVWYGGRTRNPWNPEQGSSGSSAGSASAVAAGCVPFALGTETLGSIVSPCRQCGIGGLRPTFGAVSRHGAMPLSWTMDKPGPIARSALDLALVFDAIRGADGHDACARDADFTFDATAPLRGLRIGVIDDKLLGRDDDRRFLAWLQAETAAPRAVTLPRAPYQAMLLMLHAEGAAAFDQLLRDGKLGDLPGQGAGDWPNLFRAARAIPAVEYLQASRLRTQLVQDTRQALDGIDVLVAPTHGGVTLTCTNLTGHPTCVLPIGAADDQDGGRPRVLQLVGRLHGEADLLRVAAAWQAQSAWHRRRPTVAR